MRAPVLSRRLVLETPERIADGAGGYVTTWVPLGSLWAEVAARTGRKVREGVASVSRVPVRITVRAAPHGAASRPVAGQRLREGARVFAVIAVAEADNAGRYLTCQAEEEVVA